MTEYDDIPTPAKRTAALLDTLGLLVELSCEGSEGVSEEVRERMRKVYQHFPSYAIVGLLGQYMSTWFGPLPSLEDRLIAEILEQKRTRLQEMSKRNQQTS